MKDSNIHADKFGQVWQHFQNGFRPSAYDPERVAGFDGRKTSLTLSIPIQQPEIIHKIREISAKLQGLDGIYLMPEEYYHVTVKWLGFFTDRKEKDYDIEANTLDLIIEQAENIIGEVPSFEICLKRLNGLGSFVVCEVSDNGAIARLQGRLHQDAADIPIYPLEGEEWLPHLSLAGIKSQKSISQLQHRIRQFRDVELGTVQVNQIHLSRALLQQPSPSCTTIRTFQLTN